MEIRTAKTSDVKALHEFNTRLFTEKKIDSKRYLDFWLSKSQHAINDIILLLDEKGSIVGETINSSMSYYYQDNKIHTVWGFDLIVEEKFRKDLWGLELMIQNKKMHPNIFATGSGPLALKINLKLGKQFLGEIRKYVNILNPLWFPISIVRKNININKFPKSVNLNGKSFSLIEKDKLPNFTQPFNKDLLEISREKSFLQWRFFNKLHEYAIYQEKNSNNYFVLRTTIIRHVISMILVDFRCETKIPNQFEMILKAAKKITNSLHVPILITGSSLGVFDQTLEKYHFKSIGRPRPILGILKVNERKKDIENRNFAFVTLADSDGETNWV